MEPWNPSIRVKFRLFVFLLQVIKSNCVEQNSRKTEHASAVQKPFQCDQVAQKSEPVSRTKCRQGSKIDWSFGRAQITVLSTIMSIL